MFDINKEKNPDKLRIIYTARNEEDINKAAIDGFTPLVKHVVAAFPQIKSKYAVFQNKKTNEIVVCGDYRDGYYKNDENYKTVIDWTFHYPYHFESPYAAYLIPEDIEIGEKVFLDDVIEDIVAGCWNQGNAWRLKESEAIWDGKDFEILHKKEENECVRG